ncbi:MAG: class I SAM-dependent methyltransferase [Methylococcales bacterium]
MIRSALRRLRKQLRHVRPDEESNTVWAKYDQGCNHYSEQERHTKHSFVTDALAICKAKSVLDIGANAGEYSRLAVKAGAKVVAADSDIGALQRLYRRNAVERLPITPTVLNIARPTPSVGWRNSEVPSFLDRAKGNFDLVLVLAILHHLLVSERVPLKEIIRLLEDLDARFLLIEWISPDDPKFRQIAGSDLLLYRDLNESVFRKEICARYSVISEKAIAEGRRRLFLCERA